MLYDVVIYPDEGQRTDLVTGSRRRAIRRARELAFAVTVRVIDQRGTLIDFNEVY